MQGTLKIFLKSSELGYEMRRIDEITEATAELANFLKYLEKENYLVRYIAIKSEMQSSRVGTKVMDKDFPNGYVEIEIQDEQSAKFILENMSYRFKANQALLNYLANDCRTPEEIRHRQNMRIAWVAIGISILLGLAGIWLSVSQGSSH